MSIREALMEMAHGKKPKTERASWVPESILDDDVSHFMGAAAAAKKAGKSHFDFGGKKYKVTMKHDAAKKIGESAGCAECGADGECQCEQPVQEAKVDELSTKTMKSYVKKASKQRDKAGDSYSAAAARRHDFAPDTPAMKKNAIKYDKRDSGVDMAKKKLAARESVEVEENYTDKQDASYRDEPTPKGAQKRLKALHKKALAYRKKHGKFPSDPYSAAKKSKVDLKFESVEEAVSVKKKDYKWGRMMTVHHGKSHSYPLHPEHQSAIKKLGDNEKTSFKDETGTKVTAHRQGDTVHLSSSKTNTKTPVAHSHFKESVQEATKATAQHKPTPETSDTWDKQLATRKGEKDFIDQHTMEVGMDAEKLYDQNKYEAMKKTPVRNGDKTDGDKSVVNPLSADMVTGMRKALAQMKLSGE